MPARKNPVTNRKKYKPAIPFANQMMEMLLNAAIKELTKNTFAEANLSAIEKMANTNVPAINPSCTIEVILPGVFVWTFRPL